MSDELKAGKVVRIGDSVTLILGDCLAHLPIVADAVISDPPYGMNWDTNGRRFSGGHRERAEEWSRGRDWGAAIEGDTEPFDPAPWLKYPSVVLFGCNHYAQRLPVGTTLIWIKRHPNAFGTFLSDAEVAWMKGGHGVYCKQGPHPESMAGERAHPTQKPVPLMAWCMDRAKVPQGATVLDPYMGSGSTAIACIRTGRRFIGIERDPVHFATAEQRIRRELEAGTFEFAAQPASVSQQPLL
jgi:hypothetical protein